MVLKALPCLRRLFAGLSQRTPGFYPRSVRVRSVVDTVALGQVFPRVFPYSFHHFPLLLHPSSTIFCFENRRALSRGIVYTFSKPFDEASHILQCCSSYWCCLLLIQLCRNMEGNWDEDWRSDLFNVLYLCCQLTQVLYKYSTGQTKAAVEH